MLLTSVLQPVNLGIKNTCTSGIIEQGISDTCGHCIRVSQHIPHKVRAHTLFTKSTQWAFGNVASKRLAKYLLEQKGSQYL